MCTYQALSDTGLVATQVTVWLCFVWTQHSTSWAWKGCSLAISVPEVVSTADTGETLRGSGSHPAGTWCVLS